MEKKQNKRTKRCVGDTIIKCYFLMVLLIHVAQMAGASFGLVEKLHRRQKKRNELNSVYDGLLLFCKTTVLVEQFDPTKRLIKDILFYFCIRYQSR